jgi:hypothetical protein
MAKLKQRNKKLKLCFVEIKQRNKKIKQRKNLLNL